MIAIRVCPICKKVFEGRVGVPKVYCDECTMLEDFAASDEAREQSSWFFEDFEDADYIAFFTPVYNNFFPAPIKAILDRFQRYYNARYKRGANPPIKKPKRVGAVIASGSNARQSADYMYNSLKQSFAPLGSEVCSRYYIPNTDMGRYTFNMTELQKFVHQLKGKTE